MRQQLAFSHAPVQLTPVVQSKKKRVNVSQSLVPVASVRRLQHVISQIPPHNFELLLAYGITREQIDKIRGLSVPTVLRSGYSLMQRDDSIILMQHDRFVAAGSTADVLLYCFKHHVAAVRLVLSAAQNGVYVKDPSPQIDEINMAMDSYRQIRAAVPSLDKLSKYCQLQEVDYDHVYEKFRGAPTGVAVCLGSGVLGGTHFFQIEPVDLVDTQIRYEGAEYDVMACRRAEHVDLSDYDVVVSDVALGDDAGMTKGSTFTAVPEGPASFLKLNLADEVGPRGVLFRKPRAHNLEVIWRVTPAGEEWAVARRRLISEVIAANERRNEWVMRMSIPDQRIRGHVPACRITDIYFRPWFVPPPSGRRFLRKRAKQLVEARLGSRPYKRYRAFVAALREVPPVPVVQEYCILPPSQIKIGPACFQDPEIANVEYSARSLIYSAAQHGFHVYKRGPEWTIGPPSA